MSQKQKDKFSASEGDAWFERNHAAIDQRNYNENDSIIQAIDHCLSDLTNNDLGGGAIVVGGWVRRRQASAVVARE